MMTLKRQFETVPTNKLINMLVTLEDTHMNYKSGADRDLIFSIKYELKIRNVRLSNNTRDAILSNKQKHNDYVGSTYRQVRTGRI